MVFQGTKDTTLNKLSRQIRPEIAMDPNSQISPQDLFQQYPWTALKKALSSTLIIFGQWCSVFIGLYTIFACIKGLCFYIKGCCFVRNMEYGWKDTAFYLFAPFNFLLSKQLTRNVHPSRQQTASAPEEQHSAYRNQTRTRHNEQIEELRKLTEQNHVPLYPIREIE